MVGEIDFISIPAIEPFNLSLSTFDFHVVPILLVRSFPVRLTSSPAPTSELMKEVVVLLLMSTYSTNAD